MSICINNNEPLNNETLYDLSTKYAKFVLERIVDSDVINAHVFFQRMRHSFMLDFLKGEFVGAGVIYQIGPDVIAEWGSDTCLGEKGYDRPLEEDVAEMILVELREEMAKILLSGSQSA